MYIHIYMNIYVYINVSTRLYLKCGLSMISEGFVVDAGDALGKVF